MSKKVFDPKRREVTKYLQSRARENSPMQNTEFNINRKAVASCFWARHFLGLILFIILFSPISLTVAIQDEHYGPLGFSIIFSVIYWFTFARWLTFLQAENLKYRIDGDTLRVDGGVLFLFRKSIPLERITDVALVQGPVLRFFGIWAMRIQTAGSPQAEAVLYGVKDCENVRKQILSQRHKVYNEKAGDA